MEEVNIWQRFYEKCIELGLFEVKMIKDLEATCCKTQTTEVIDFDKTKQIACARYNLREGKSYDALKINSDNGEFDFIEMKGFSNYLSTISRTEDDIENKLEGYYLNLKISESIKILGIITNDNRMPQWTKNERRKFQSLTYRYILLTDIEFAGEPIDEIVLSLEFLSQSSNFVKSKADSLLSAIQTDKSYKVSEAFIMSCQNIDAYYSD